MIAIPDFLQGTSSSRRLTYRPVDDRDRPHYRRMLEDGTVTEPAGFPALTDATAFEAFFLGLRDNGGALAILLEDTPIGYVRVYPCDMSDSEGFADKRCASLGFVIGKPWQRQGYGTEMLQFMTERVKGCFDYAIADAFVDNAASNRLIVGCGYQYLEDYTMFFEELGREMTCHSYYK